MGGKLTNGERINAKRALEVFEKIKEVVGEDGVYLTGSLRREKVVVGDLDIVIVREEGASDLNARLHDLTGVDLSKRKQISFVFEGVQVDLNLCSAEVKGTYLMHWTGSMKENIRLRNQAKRLGFKLSQNGLIDSEGVNRAINCTEEQVYELLKTSYVEPNRR